jgi:hypothetical protein
MVIGILIGPDDHISLFDVVDVLPQIEVLVGLKEFRMSQILTDGVGLNVPGD